MEKVIYKTLAECEAAINTLKVIGVTIPDWMVKQHKELKTASKRQGSGNKYRYTNL